VLSSKTPAGRTTAPDAELFAIRLDVSKATSMNIKHIILITDSLGSNSPSSLVVSITEDLVRALESVFKRLKV